MIRVKIGETTRKTSANQTDTLRLKICLALLILFYLYFIQSWEDVFISFCCGGLTLSICLLTLTVELVMCIVLSFSFIKQFYFLKFYQLPWLWFLNCQYDMKKHKIQGFAVYVLGGSGWGWLALTCLFISKKGYWGSRMKLCWPSFHPYFYTEIAKWYRPIRWL